jgi:hypothetical protein
MNDNEKGCILLVGIAFIVVFTLIATLAFNGIIE